MEPVATFVVNYETLSVDVNWQGANVTFTYELPYLTLSDPSGSTSEGDEDKIIYRSRTDHDDQDIMKKSKKDRVSAMRKMIES